MKRLPRECIRFLLIVLCAFSPIATTTPLWGLDGASESLLPAPLVPARGERMTQSRLAAAGIASSRTMARISLTSEPAGATVWLDGLEQGKTPLSIEVPIDGWRALCLEKEGYRSRDGTVPIERGKELELHLILSRAKGTLELAPVLLADNGATAGSATEGTPGQAPSPVVELLLDGQPIAPGTHELDSGMYRVRASAFGYAAVEQRIIIREDTTSSCALTLEATDSALLSLRSRRRSLNPARGGPLGTLPLVIRASGPGKLHIRALDKDGSPVMEDCLIPLSRPSSTFNWPLEPPIMLPPGMYTLEASLEGSTEAPLRLSFKVDERIASFTGTPNASGSGTLLVTHPLRAVAGSLAVNVAFLQHMELSLSPRTSPGLLASASIAPANLFLVSLQGLIIPEGETLAIHAGASLDVGLFSRGPFAGGIALSAGYRFLPPEGTALPIPPGQIAGEGLAFTPSASLELPRSFGTVGISSTLALHELFKGASSLRLAPGASWTLEPGALHVTPQIRVVFESKGAGLRFTAIDYAMELVYNRPDSLVLPGMYLLYRPGTSTPFIQAGLSLGLRSED